MTIATLKDVLIPCLSNNTAVAGLVVLGWEDAVAYVRAAELVGRPVVLQVGPGSRNYTPLSVLGPMLRNLAEKALVPIVIHLDHGNSICECKVAFESGFTSVMFDGSNLSLEENIDKTGEICSWAHSHGLSVEGELGFVGYQDGYESQGTDPLEVNCFVRETGVDALAISVGNRHLMLSPGVDIDLELLMAIQTVVPDQPLVLHGGSGIGLATRKSVSRNTNVCKINIGTELRVSFGTALRDVLSSDITQFDRIKILEKTIMPVCVSAQNAITSLM
ncbi:class II fructose-bisphosphate aldolase [Acidiphilium sp.]|uniref:class II fructose-bisphosphate aldolase n=1 Tax=Acidiphilium sp. TaxID=527 RepID=UPI003CFD2847